MRRPALPMRLGLIGLTLPLSACLWSGSSHTTAMEAVPMDASASTEMLAQTKDNLDALTPPAPTPAKVMMVTEVTPTIKGLGYSQVSTQPGKSLNEKRLMAIRAARLEAMRDLTEQVHGIRLTSQTSIRDMVLRSDTLNGVVSGEIRGARTVRITP
ncbi:MAG: hypothetical protein VX202_02465, partial [Pseudomonadota bacterium]|nr:hypothetical protein [Pseudomonadota bacterium]